MAYTNSPLVSYTKLSPNHSGQRTHSIDRITPHCVVGQCSVETLGNIMYPTSRQASCNYGKVNELMGAKTTEEVAQEVIAGKWGNGEDRKQRLTAAGYNYGTVQAKVNKLICGFTPAPSKSIAELAQEVIQGKWENGEERKQRLTAAGYDYSAVQYKVNQMMGTTGKTVDQLAREVIYGYWGNGDDRQIRLTAAGYDYNTVQKRVNELLK